MNKQNICVLIIVVILLGATACSNGRDRIEENPLGRAVRIVEAEQAEAHRQGTPLAGVVRAKGQVDLAFQLGGLVTDVFVSEGDEVTVGTVLATIDSVPFEASRDQALGALRHAEAALALAKEGARSQEISVARAQVRAAEAASVQAKADFDRARRLLESGVWSQKQFDAQESAYSQVTENLEAASEQLAMALEGSRPQQIEAAEAIVLQARGAHQAAQRQLEYTRLKSPASGVIVMRKIEIGMSISRGETVFELANLNELEIEAEIPESDLKKISIGDKARITFPALEGIECEAEVTHISPKARENTRGFPVKLSLIQPDEEIVPGLISLVEYSYRHIPHSTRIPSRAVVDGDVFIVEGGKAVKRRVNVLLTRGEYLYVSGVEPGECVVINGQHYLTEGETVNIVDALAIGEITSLQAN